MDTEIIQFRLSLSRLYNNIYTVGAYPSTGTVEFLPALRKLLPLAHKHKDVTVKIKIMYKKNINVNLDDLLRQILSFALSSLKQMPKVFDSEH